ncbi:MAG TPA: GNAT family N-acetyltransferase [Acidimicrobiia bacterium]
MTDVRPGTEADASLAATLHASEIGDGFLPSLGRSFLTRLYRRIVRSPGSFLLVAEADGDTLGFIAGTDDVRELYRSFLVRDGLVAAISALPQVLRSSRRVLETLRYGTGTGGGTGNEPSHGPSEADLPKAELLAIAVAPRARGRGAGRALVDAFTAELTRRGVPGARVVVGADNDAAIRLYERCGFTKVARIEVHRGTPSQVLTWP